VASGGTVVVSSGAAADSTIIGSGGREIIAGGTANGSLVESGGLEQIRSGGGWRAGRRLGPAVRPISAAAPRARL
jgi:autotransporter passenger strand-loop-strand repeat protein